jgi:hypothetical protein
MKTLFQQSRLFRHSLFWGGIFVFIMLLNLLNPGNANQRPQQIFVNFCIEVFPVLLFFTYFFLYLTLPFFFKRNYVIGSLLFVASIYLTGYFGNFLYELQVAVIKPLLAGESPQPFCECFFERSPLQGPIYYFVFVGMFAGGIKILRHWLEMQAENERLATEKITTELQLLKTQINPDFLFDILTDLHLLTLQKSRKSPEVVLQLSNLLSYLLYESQSEEVSLQKEIEMIQNYVFLAKTRPQNNVEVSLNFTGEIEGKQIAPLLLLPFVENAFKKDTSLEQAWVSIELSVTEGQMKFKIIHGTSPQAEKNYAFDNVIRRLNLLYPKRYNLKILPEEEMFLVRLEIALDKHTSPKPQHNHETTLSFGR